MRYDDEIEALLGGTPDEPEGETVSAHTLGDWLGLSPARIHALAREGAIPRGGDNRFPLKAAVRAYAERIRAGQLGRMSSHPELTAEKLRLAKASAEKIELANAKARGELVPVAEVESSWAAVLRDVRAAMLSIPARVAANVGHLSPRDVQLIDREVRDALEECSNDHD